MRAMAMRILFLSTSAISSETTSNIAAAMPATAAAAEAHVN